MRYDDIYDRDPRDIDLEDVPVMPRERLPPPEIDYEPIDDDESYAVDMLVAEVEDGCVTQAEAEAEYRRYVRRHRRYE